MLLGIDLGTTYSCVAFIDENGMPKIIPNTDAQETTPSVIWFDGKAACVGKKANDRKITPTSPIYEFVKRDMGKPRHINSRYEINGYYYGAAGMSAIILRKLKKEAFLFFRKNGILPKDAEEKSTIIPAVITVPAYFGDLQRQETRKAGYAAGLDVVAIINEPTAAALAYGRTLQENKKILVFDLGGGTLDVTILRIQNGDSIVLTSDGADELGGKDWDELIMDYLYSEFRKRTGKDIPEDMGWDIQQKALEAKFELTVNEQTNVIITSEGDDVEITLYRSNPLQNDMNDLDMDTEAPFYFEERSSNLLSLCRTICTKALEKANLSWGDIDDIILAGGACRMPMIPDMLEALSKRKIPRNIPGFSYDTAIATGAVIYGTRRNRVKDVTSKAVGIEVKINGKPYIEPLIERNRMLPVKVEQDFPAESNAILKIYEGESRQPDECVLRGRLELGNPPGNVKVTITVNEDGVLGSIVEFPPDARKELWIQSDDVDIDKHELRNKINEIDIRL
ncbi:Hsp70 family protein [uncultured Chitinophaga sp.]|jgi:Molecular chaperone|uniref:Hsp70 family protein n=1 Tax=uncultured Chitinophaga sp. TaxID=339340 RepID=UPI00260EA734|nr:Hsp70 family protein [uncultured Chitinophaga sp.]